MYIKAKTYGRYFLACTLYVLMHPFLQAQQTDTLYLSGTGMHNTKTWEFYCTNGMNSGKWSTIQVPSCWELQGFGKYDYGFAKDSLRGKEQGRYRYQFEVPASWKGKTIKIAFKGVMTDAEVKVNGKLAGPIHQGAFYTFRYDITNLLKIGGKNLLEVTVAKHSANESVNQAERRADFWIFGGIFRPVLLEATPTQHIQRVAIDAKADGSFKASVFADKASSGYSISTSIYTLQGDKIGNEISTPLSADDATLNTKFEGIKPWTPETPHLYVAKFNLVQNGKTIHQYEQRFGFRTVEVKQRDGIYVNGVKVKMKGVNRHSFWPTTGRTTNKQLSIDDVLLMKDMNMNAVRMSHYPPDDHFLDVCDSLGVFVMNELAGWHGHYDTETGSKLLKEMIQQDVNHPSIIFWANGNEGGHNLELDSLFGNYDIQKRPVVHPWQLFGGFETQHYRQYNYGIAGYDNGPEIVMPTEFLHGQFDGGHGAGLQDYWEKMWHSPRSAGGFLWDFSDQAVVRKDLNDSLDTDKHRGADGIVGPYRQKEGSYFTIKEIWSPVYLEDRIIEKDFNKKLVVQNRYHFTNLKQCSFQWKLKHLHTGKTDSGIIQSPDLLPNQYGTLTLNLPGNWLGYEVLYITAKDHTNHELFTWSFPISKPETVLAANLPTDTGGKPVLAERNNIYSVIANGVHFDFNKTNGLLVKASNTKGIIPMHNGPILQHGENNFKGITWKYDGDTLIISSTFDRKESYNTLHWRIFPSGWVNLEVQYFPGAFFTDFIGINFSFPEEKMQAVEYMGDGPYRVWKNRLKGNQFGIWKKHYNDTETGETWNYPEFKGYHSKMYWVKFLNTEQDFTVYTENENLFFRLFTPAWKTDEWHNYEPLFPSGDISFMQGIASIGNKTQRNITTGPMGMQHIFYDYEKDPVRALKIVLWFNFRE